MEKSESNFKNYVYEDLKKQIVTGKLSPGTLINEKKYAKEMGVSRTPVHEAVQKLAQEGMLVIMPRCGTLVSHISIEDIRQLYELRKILEPQIVKLAAPKASADDLTMYKDYYINIQLKEPVSDSENSWLMGNSDSKFHIFLAESTGNSLLVKYIKEAMDQTMRIRCLSNTISAERFLHACGEHIEIIEAMLQSDCDAAAEAMMRHLENSEKGYINTKNIQGMFCI